MFYKSDPAFQHQIPGLFSKSPTVVDRATIKVPAIAPGVPLVALRAMIANPLLEVHHKRAVLDDLASLMMELDDRQPVHFGTRTQEFKEAVANGAGKGKGTV
ncbi:MAG TPA: hypothetical protein VG759_27655 [Candidatus Angelobacter sp.]|jgi:hypothetical protein|nr:hypothetical protein [Candidatus Angelobacter sp.]